MPSLPVPASAPLAVLDKAIEHASPLAASHVSRLRAKGDRTPAQVVSRLNAELRSATISSGAAVGLTAAAPGAGTAVAAALTVGEMGGFLGAAAFYVLCRAEVHGVHLSDLEHKRTLIMGIVLGDSGFKSIEEVAGTTGKHWGKTFVSAVPASRISAVNKVLGRNFVTRYGQRQGVIVLGRLAPLGVGAVIGGAANAVTSQAVISASNRAFGSAPLDWSDYGQIDTIAQND